MHRCLRIEEILSIIFSNVQERGGPLPRKGSRDLVNLATTCRTFNSPALDALWHLQSSLFFLLKVLPTDYLSSSKLNTTILTRRPTREQYERLIFYSSRIREIRNGISRYNVPLHYSVFSILLSTQTLYRLPLLPKLKVCTGDLASFSSQATYPRLYIGPNLRTLEIEAVHWQDGAFNWDNITAVIKPCALTLETFKLETNGTERIMRYGSPPGVLDLLPAFERLHNLAIRNFDLDALALLHIATFLPDLRELSFGILDKDLKAFIALSLPPDTEQFPSLLHLTIDVDSLSACSNFLARPAFKALEILSITQSVGGMDWDFRTFFQGLTPSQNLKRLRLRRDVYIDGDEEDMDIPDPSPFDLATLSPLFRFTGLTSLAINMFNLQVQLCDPDLDTIAKAWPQLQVLQLPDTTLDTPQPEITFNGLLRFVQSCTSLEHLILRVNCIPLPIFAETGPVFAPSMQVLDFCTSPMRYYDSLAATLHLVFPALTSLHYADVYSNTSNEDEEDGVVLSEWEKKNGLAWMHARRNWVIAGRPPKTTE